MVMEVQHVNKIGNQNARFWTRPDIEHARTQVDIWSSQIKHSEAVLVPIHKVTRVNNMPTPTETGKQYGLEGDLRALHRDSVMESPWPLSHTSFTPITQNGLRSEIQTKILVGHAINSFLEDPIENMCLHGLLLWLYPRLGPYENPHNIEEYRPVTWVEERRKAFKGHRFERHLDDMLGKMHRGFLLHLRQELRATA